MCFQYEFAPGCVPVEAIKYADDFYGRTVVIAARISALALGAEIFASDRVYALAQGLGTFTSSMRATATPKGLDHSFDPRPVLG
jgi:class 3 adenylate cyclase